MKHRHPVLFRRFGNLFIAQGTAGMGHELHVASVCPVDIVAERNVGIG